MEGNIQQFIENFFLFANKHPTKNKIVIGSGIKGIHYTIHLGGKSGNIDFHKTNEQTGEHMTLFIMKREDIIKIINTVSQYLPSLLLTLLPRKKSISWLNRNKWRLLPINIQSEKFVKIKGNRFKFSKNIHAFKNLILVPNEIHKSKDLLFLVYDQKYKLQGATLKCLYSKEILFINKKKYSLLFKNYLHIIKGTIISLNLEEEDIILTHISNITEELSKEFTK